MSDSLVPETSSVHVFLISVIFGATVFVVIYIAKLLNSTSDVASKENIRQKNKNESVPKNVVKEKVQLVTNLNNKNKKKTTEVRWSGRGDKHSFAHPWLLTSLKGHNGAVLDMDFSSNGKYLATCGEDTLDPGGDVTTSSGSECNKENSRPPSVESRKIPSLTRRQRKNRRPREDSGSSPEVTKRKSKPKRRRAPGSNMTWYPPLRQHTKLNIEESELYGCLRGYLLMPEQLLTLGYPVESELCPGQAIVYKNPGEFQPREVYRFDVNAREFVPRLTDRETNVVIVNKNDNLDVMPGGANYIGNESQWNDMRLSGDSGQGSGSSSPVSVESESSESVDPDDAQELCGISNGKNAGEERKCVRCGRGFFLGPCGEYLTQEHCFYHWGKLQRAQTQRQYYRNEYACCKGDKTSLGCTIGQLHVWNGVANGINGPLEGFVGTLPRAIPAIDNNYGVYALDCEMCFTAGGLELTKVTVVASDGRLVYDCFVKPDNEIIDYNTRFSGITAQDLNRKSATKSLREVQFDLLSFIDADTILIGHGLENDLRALRLIHKTVVDTAVTFPHYFGSPYRRSLKSLTSHYLRREIQCGSSGHNSFEDARACMEIMLWKVRKDFRNTIDTCQ